MRECFAGDHFRQRSRSIVPALLLVACGVLEAQAARPFVTDDARVVDEGGWQVETFVKRQRAFGESEFWILPAHNPGGRAEFTVGGYQLDNSIDGRSRAALAQAKILLRPLETNGYGCALTLGVLSLHPPGSARSQTNPYLNAIGSFSLREDRIVVHANLGVRRDQGAGMNRGTWGLGSELSISERWIAIVEAYGERGAKPTRHTGIRYWAVPNRLQLDTTVGEERNTPAKRFYTLGMRVLF